MQQKSTNINNLVPIKPTNIENYIDENIKTLHKELMQSINKNSHYWTWNK